MEHKWQEITQHLYDHIKPLGGEVHSRIDTLYPRRNKVENIWIEFDMNEFMYVDPFYGEQKSTSMFRMNIELWDYIAKSSIHSIFDLENFTLKCDQEDLIGSFSNSLHFSVRVIKFGQIRDRLIDFEMEYCMTNSDSYGMMTGTIKDHMTTYGTMQTTLKLNDLLVCVRKDKSPSTIARYLDPKIFDLDNITLAKDLNRSYPNEDEYWVPYRADYKNQYS